VGQKGEKGDSAITSGAGSNADSKTFIYSVS